MPAREKVALADRTRSLSFLAGISSSLSPPDFWIRPTSGFVFPRVFKVI